MWHSSDLSTTCSKCKDDAGGGFHTVFEAVNDPENPAYAGHYIFVPFNEAKTSKEAIDVLVDKGINRAALKVKL